MEAMVAPLKVVSVINLLLLPCNAYQVQAHRQSSSSTDSKGACGMAAEGAGVSPLCLQ